MHDWGVILHHKQAKTTVRILGGNLGPDGRPGGCKHTGTALVPYNQIHHQHHSLLFKGAGGTDNGTHNGPTHRAAYRAVPY